VWSGGAAHAEQNVVLILAAHWEQEGGEQGHRQYFVEHEEEGRAEADCEFEDLGSLIDLVAVGAILAY